MKKYVKYLPLVVLLIISIKPVLFTWNLIVANYRLHRSGEQSSAYSSVVACLETNDSAYTVFKKLHSRLTDRFVVTSTIYRNDLQTFTRLGLPPKEISRLKKHYSDNFYLRFLPSLLTTEKKKTSVPSVSSVVQKQSPPSPPQWQNLDEVSLAMLADPAMNSRTIAIFKQIGSTFDQIFLTNLADYLTWKGNRQLGTYLKDTYHITPTKGTPPAIATTDSFDYLKKYVSDTLGIPGESIEANLIQYPDFETNDTSKRFVENWYFSKMASKTFFAKGSFTIGHDKANGNGMLRIMGFLVTREEGKRAPRGGVWSKKRFYTGKGVYLFSFDYRTRTGKENPSFYLGKELPRELLPPAKKRWKKFIYLVDNRSGKYSRLKPLIRMWGTGSMWVDNVYLGKITKPDLTIQQDVMRFVEKMDIK